MRASGSWRRFVSSSPRSSTAATCCSICSCGDRQRRELAQRLISASIRPSRPPTPTPCSIFSSILETRTDRTSSSSETVVIIIIRRRSEIAVSLVSFFIFVFLHLPFVPTSLASSALYLSNFIIAAVATLACSLPENLIPISTCKFVSTQLRSPISARNVVQATDKLLRSPKILIVVIYLASLVELLLNNSDADGSVIYQS